MWRFTKNKFLEELLDQRICTLNELILQKYSINLDLHQQSKHRMNQLFAAHHTLGITNLSKYREKI